MCLELLIIGLHRVGSAPPEAKIRGLFISSGQLEFFLLLIQAMGFEFAVLKDALAKKWGKFAVVTFDDGYEDNLKNGFPVLQKLNIPATVFVITDDVGKENVSWEEAADDLPSDLLSWEQLKYLQENGWEIGSHSQNHRHLTRRAPLEQEESILFSIEAIRQNLGVEPTSFAYPYGDFDDSTKNILKRCGVKCGVTIQPARTLKFTKDTDLFELSRISLGGEKRRHYFRNISRLAKAVGVKMIFQALLKRLSVRTSLLTK